MSAPSVVSANDAIKKKALELYPQADTDGDGVSDLEEVKAGRNPNGSAVADVNNATQLVVFTPLQP